MTARALDLRHETYTPYDFSTLTDYLEQIGPGANLTVLLSRKIA